MSGARLHACIVGGGVGGLTLANVLRSTYPGVRLVCCEQAPELSPTAGAGLGLARSGMDILSRLDLDAAACSGGSYRKGTRATGRAARG